MYGWPTWLPIWIHEYIEIRFSLISIDFKKDLQIFHWDEGNVIWKMKYPLRPEIAFFIFILSTWFYVLCFQTRFLFIPGKLYQGDIIMVLYNHKRTNNVRYVYCIIIVWEHSWHNWINYTYETGEGLTCLSYMWKSQCLISSGTVHCTSEEQFHPYNVLLNLIKRDLVIVTSLNQQEELKVLFSSF